MSTFEIQSGDLAALDRLAIDTLVVPLYAVRRQPQGVAGALDWRLAGLLARWLKDGVFTGKSGELLLTNGLGRIGARRIFLVGLGAPASSVANDSSAPIAKIVRALEEAEVSEAALAVPESPPGATATGPNELVESWLAAISEKRLSRLVALDSGRLDRPRVLERARQSGWTA